MKQVLGGVLAFASGIAFGLALGWRNEPEGPVYVYRDLPTVTEAHIRDISVDDNGMGVAPVETSKIVYNPEQVRHNLRENLEKVEAITVPYSGTDPVVNDGLEMITEEVYNSYEEDFDKCTIEVFKDDLQSITVLDGETVANWQTLIGEDALEDLVGQTSIFVRNHRNHTDYEVTWGRP